MKLSKKGLLLFGAALAVCAFAVPSMASAGSWGVIGTSHTLDSPNLAFTGIGPGGLSIGSSCGDTQFHVDVRSAAIVTITAGTFRNCTGTGTLGAGCTVTATGTGFHWNATGTSTTNVQIHGVDVDVTFEAHPSGSTCLAAGTVLTLGGTLNGGQWDAATHELTFAADSGLTATTGTDITVTGTIRDTSNSLTLTD
jgi:hypothetical protein